MINIISRAYCRYYQSGPKKVVDNLIKGLALVGYPYVVNKRLDACKRLWVHDDMLALQQTAQLPGSVKVVVGPNLVVLPRNLPRDVHLSNVVYIHPSNWAKEYWQDFGFAACPIVAWPTGIDTNEFFPSAKPKTFVLVYFKQRSMEELEQVKRVLEAQRIAYKVLAYPQYRESEYKELLSGTRYVIWLGRQESQGIALQEGLSCGVPMIVWDVTHMGQWQASQREMSFFNDEEQAHWATSAEYFDESCGLKVYTASDLPAAVHEMEARLAQFNPRGYILKHLSLEKQARDFIRIYETYYQLSFEEGMHEGVLAHGNWKNRGIRFRLVFMSKDIAKTIIRLAKRYA